MPEPMTEFMNGGLVTARHPALLFPGELQKADDTVYHEKDPAIWRAPGRTVYNSTALGDGIKGLVHLTFDNQRTDQLLVHETTRLLYGNFTAITGSFSEMGGPGQVTGTVSGGNTFVAASGSPFLADAVGTRVWQAGVSGAAKVSTVTVQDGTTGHYSTLTFEGATLSNGTSTLTFEWGVVQALENEETEILDAAQWQSSYYVWFGHGTPRRIGWRARPTLSGGSSLSEILTQRPVGLKAVGTAPTVAAISSTVSGWNATLGTGVYWFLITEIYAPGGDVIAAEKNPALAGEIIEGAYLAADATAADPNAGVGRPIPVTITNTSNQNVRITFPAVANTGLDGRLATNWGVYMYGPTDDTATAPSLAQFRRVATPAITTFAAGAQVTLGDVQTVQASYPGTVAAGGGVNNFSDSSNALVNDFAVARAKSGTSTDGSEQQEPAAMLLSNFSSFSVAAPWDTRTIVGIELAIKGGADPSGNAGTAAGYYYSVSTSGGKLTPVQTGAFYQKPLSYNYHGGPLDTMGVTWTTSDLSTIRVTVGKTGTGARQRLMIDSVLLKVYFSGSTVNLNGPAYRVITYRDQVGTTVSDPANLIMPDCSTGDIWHGSLVVNNLGQDSQIRYSLPGRIESFPKPYFLSFESRKKDKVTFIRSLNQVLIVGMRDSIKRVNYLPRETDTDFQQGIAHEDLAADHGIPGPLAGAKFDMPGGGTVLMYASYNGMFITDGITVRPVSLDLDWASLVNLTNLNSCVLRNYPKQKWIVFYYNPAGASHAFNTRAIVFSYARDKVKDGGFLPCTGPITVSGRSACEATLSGVPYLLTGHQTDGKVYVEDSGVAQAASYQVHDAAGSLADAKITPHIRTRRIYPAGMHRDAREERIFLLFDKYGATISANGDLTEDSVTVTATSASGFSSVTTGMRVIGTGLDPATIVATKASDDSITLSRAPYATGTGVALTFDTGTLSITVRGSSIGENVSSLDTSYPSTLVGDTVVVHNDNTKQGLELDIQKVLLPDASTVDLGVNMRLHQFTILLDDQGMEQNRSSS